MSNMIWIVHAVIDSCDHYYFAYYTQPTKEAVIKRIWEAEMAEDLDWYMDTTSVYIFETEIEQ